MKYLLHSQLLEIPNLITQLRAMVFRRAMALYKEHQRRKDLSIKSLRHLLWA